MAGRKYGMVMAAKVPGSYHALPESEQEIPGKAFDEVFQKHAGKIDFVRRYWTSAFSADVSDVFVFECDDLMDAHNFNQDLTKAMAKEGDPDRFGETVVIWVGVNPDA
jgi:arginine/lysine/ornithine decarboxylase